MAEYAYFVKQSIQSELDFNTKLITKLDGDITKSNVQLTAVKLKVSALQLEMLAMTALYQDIMELRRLMVLLNPHLKKAR